MSNSDDQIRNYEKSRTKLYCPVCYKSLYKDDLRLVDVRNRSYVCPYCQSKLDEISNDES